MEPLFAFCFIEFIFLGLVFLFQYDKESKEFELDFWTFIGFFLSLATITQVSGMGDWRLII